VIRLGQADIWSNVDDRVSITPDDHGLPLQERYSIWHIFNFTSEVLAWRNW